MRAVSSTRRLFKTKSLNYEIHRAQLQLKVLFFLVSCLEVVIIASSPS